MTSITQRGFTLIEAVIVVALTGVMMVVLTQFFFGGNQTYRSQNAELDVNMAARAALDDIDAYTRQASQALASYDIYNAGSQVLILELPAVNSSSLIVPGALDRVVFYLSGSELYRRTYADAASTRQSTTRRIAEDLSALSFTYDNATYSAVTAVETDLSASVTNGRDTRTISVSSKSRMRN